MADMNPPQGLPQVPVRMPTHWVKRLEKEAARRGYKHGSSVIRDAVAEHLGLEPHQPGARA